VGRIHSKFRADTNELDAASFDLRKRALRATGKGGFAWKDGPINLDARFQGVDLAADKKLFPTTLPVASGIASGSAKLSGSMNRPSGTAHIIVEKGEAYGEHFDHAQLDATLESDKWRIANGRLDKGPATLHFSGDYQPVGRLHFKLDSNVFALSLLDRMRSTSRGWTRRRKFIWMLPRSLPRIAWSQPARPDA